MSSNFSAQPPTSRKRTVFRVQKIPSKWSTQTLNENLRRSFSEHLFRIHSLCKHPVRPTKTALVTFDSPTPEVLLPLAQDAVRDYELVANGQELMFDHCLGLTTLSEPDGENPVTADILFVHGLSGHAVGSWTSSNGKCWPRDFLGKDSADIRVMTFGYEARLERDSSTSQLSDFGGQLLEDLFILRGTIERQKRPLILIGHSFGGTIINWVLHELSSKAQKPEYNNTLSAIKCATFFSTPHQGMSVQFLEPLTHRRQHDAMKRTLQDLTANSEILKMLGDALRNLSENVKFITCIEQKLTAAPSIDGQSHATYQAVDHHGALVYSKDEDVIRIQADHREMIKFSSEVDRYYLQVLNRLKTVLEDCRQPGIKNCRTLTTEQRRDLVNSLRVLEVEERLNTIKDAHEMTSEWLVKSAEYKAWLSFSEGSKLDDSRLWVYGGAAGGKSTIMKNVFMHHRKQHRDHLVMGFFFDAHGIILQKTAKGMYRSMLLQALEGTERVPCDINILSQWIRGSLPTWTSSALQELLEYLIPLLGRPVVCYIDAIDECQSSDLQDVITFFDSLTQRCAKQQSMFRICLSGRNGPSTHSVKSRAIFLDQHDNHQQDILRYAEHKLQIGHDENTNRVRQMLKERSSGNFLWAKLVIQILNEVHTSDRASLLERLHMIPVDLCGLYRHILTKENNNSCGMFSCLQRMLQANTSFTINELYLLLLSDTGQANLMEYQLVPSSEELGTYFLRLCKGLVEITDCRTPAVQFIHPSVSDFLHGDQGVRQILQSQQPEFAGMSHERLKQSCLDVIGTVQNESDVSLEVVKYAVENVLHHANEAAKDGISQVQFLGSFPLAYWIQLINLLLGRPRFATNTSLLHVLADQNMPELMAALPRRVFELDSEPELHRGGNSPTRRSLSASSSRRLESLQNGHETKHKEVVQFQPQQHQYSTLPYEHAMHGKDVVLHERSHRHHENSINSQDMLSYNELPYHAHHQSISVSNQMATYNFVEPTGIQHMQQQNAHVNAASPWDGYHHDTATPYQIHHQGNQMQHEEHFYTPEQVHPHHVYHHTILADHGIEGSENQNEWYDNNGIEEQRFTDYYPAEQQDEGPDSDVDDNTVEGNDDDNYSIEGNEDKTYEFNPWAETVY